MSFADKLKQLRKEKGITQVELADAIGVERSSIGKYEGSKHVMPSDDVKLRIAEYFGVSIDYLLDYDIRREAINQLKKQLETEQAVELFSDLSPEELQRVRDFVAGLKASRKA